MADRSPARSPARGSKSPARTGGSPARGSRAAADAPGSPGRSPARAALTDAPSSPVRTLRVLAEGLRSPSRTPQGLDGQPQRGTPKRLRVKGPDEWPEAPGTPRAGASPTPPRARSLTPSRLRRKTSPSPARINGPLALRGSGDARALGFIHRLTIENFKSYEGVHEIGPFEKFCCVIGPNGSGKSNVMDAISFCLGIRAKHLRGDRLKDLVYRREEESADANKRSARVTIHFHSARGEMIDFERVIRAGGESVYRYGISGQKTRAVTYDEFLKYLSDEHINVKARNFLVFQGDVMDMARKQGKDLSGLLESISGADQLKEQYESLLSELEITQEKARMHYQHLTEIRQTVQQLKKQHEVVQRFQTLSNEKTAVLQEMNVFKLFSYHMESEKSKRDYSASAAEVRELDNTGKALTKDIAEADNKHKLFHKDMEKAWNAKVIFSSNAEYQKPSLNNSYKTVEHYTKKMKQVEKDIADQSKVNTGSEAKLADIKAEHKRVTNRIMELKSKILPTIHLTQKQRQVYDEACIKAESNNLRAREQRREADDQLRQVRQDMQNDAQDLRDLTDRGDRGEQKVEAVAAEMAELKKQISGMNAEDEQSAQQRDLIEKEMQTNLNFRTTLQNEERQATFNLDLQQTKRERLERAEAKIRLADELRAQFPNEVIGRVSELVVPAQKRFELALQTALASKADAFVVVDHKAGVKCINFLKSRRIGAEVFLPLNRLKGWTAAEALHGLTQGHQARRLAGVCIKHNEKFLESNPLWQENGSAIIDKVMSSLLGGTVIVDDLMEARSVAYKDALARKLTIKTVSLNGEVILPNGNMEVKSGSSLGVVEFGGMDELNKMRQTEARLKEVQIDLRVVDEQISSKRQLQESVAIQRDAHRRRVSELQDRMALFKTAQKAEQKGLEAKQTRIQELQAKAKKHAAKERKLGADRESAEAELLQRGKKHFAVLSAELGVPDVQELMLNEEAAWKRLQQELEEYEDKLRDCEARELSLSERLEVNQKVVHLKKDLAGFKAKIDDEEKRAAVIKERIEGFTQNFLIEEKRYTWLKGQAEEWQEKTAKLKEGVQEKKDKREAAYQKTKMIQGKTHRVLAQSCRILRDCREEGIEIPFRHVDHNQLDKITSRGHDIDDISVEDLTRAFEGVMVDFACLPEDKVEHLRVLDSRLGGQNGKAAAGNGSDPNSALELLEPSVYEFAQNVEREYQERVAEIKVELDTLNPNMNATKEHQMEAAKLEEIKKQGDEAASRVTELEAKFEETKALRTSRFMNCFQHVEAVVQPFYKELTSYDGYEGGSAYLDLDDAEEPYNGGITFTACPPGKRFFPMELLSGGEKSMASMALLFAMHSYQPPPFMILDEVDAPFDKKNTDSLVRYLQKLKFQCLVISLKDTFFKNSDALVGIYKDKVAQTSGVITLPLSRLGDESHSGAALADAD